MSAADALTEAQVAELRALAEKATPGPWTWKEELRRDDMPRLLSPDGRVCDFGNAEQYYPTEGSPPSDEDAAYIAAANPATVLALLADRTALAARVEGLERERGEWERRADHAKRQKVKAQAARVASAEESSRFHQERARQAEEEVERLRKRLDAAAPHICLECGPHAKVDEDGCCATCGADTYFASDPYAPPTPPAPEGGPVVTPHEEITRLQTALAAAEGRNSHAVVCSADPQPYVCGCLLCARDRADDAEAKRTEGE